jgi:hypothetical protein
MTSGNLSTNSNAEINDTKQGDGGVIKFDYQNLLSANLNLADMVDSGKGFYFDCPPIDYNFREANHPPYWKEYETVNGVMVKIKHPKILEKLFGINSSKEVTLEAPDIVTKNKLMQELYEEDYMKHTKIKNREYSRLWAATAEKIFGGNLVEAKANVVKAAVEGGLRLKRRQKNIELAFTYGQRITYDDLDNPHFKGDILNRMRKK